MLAENLKKIREEKTISKLELARRTGLSARGIEFIEHKKVKSPGLLTIEKLAAALGVTIEEILK